MDLNPSQREAVETLRGPLLVLAGAGSGKTRVVTYRIARLIRGGVRPSRILAVTFTNKAADEMQERAGQLLGKRQVERPEISTFHSLCVRVLRRQIQRLGYPTKFAIYDRGDQEALARRALREIRVPNEQLRPGDLLGFIGRWKSAAVRPATAVSAAATDKEHLAAAGYRKYQAALKSAGAVDFDDLLMLTEEVFSQHAGARRAEAARFDHVLIDEYQDTNGSQYRIVQALAEGHRNLCVVGDDDQSIYGWRGAEVTHILNFSRDWPEAKVVRLEDNYRSQALILDAANRLIVHNRVRHAKVLRPFRPAGEPVRIEPFADEMAEAKQVVAEIAARIAEQQAAPREIAILFRTNEQPRAFEAELRQQRVPYVLIGGQSFFDRKEVRDVLAYLKLLVHPDDDTHLRRIINTPPRGIGDATIEQLAAAAVAEGKPIWEILPRAAELKLPKAAVAAIENFRATMERAQPGAHQRSLARWLEHLLEQVNYRGEIERQYSEPADQATRWDVVEGIVNTLAEYERGAKSPTLAGFLEKITLDPRDDGDEKESQLERNAVVLMTLHSAKGLEFPHVYLVGMEESILPHQRSIDDAGAAIDEERRLCYVGVTRARESLTMTLALERTKWGRQRASEPSRFLFELIEGEPDEVLLEAQRRARYEAAIRQRSAALRGRESEQAGAAPSRGARPAKIGGAPKLAAARRPKPAGRKPARGKPERGKPAPGRPGSAQPRPRFGRPLDD